MTRETSSLDTVGLRSEADAAAGAGASSSSSSSLEEKREGLSRLVCRNGRGQFGGGGGEGRGEEAEGP